MTVSMANGFRKVQVYNADLGRSVELLVDLGSRFVGRDRDGTPLVTTHTAYGKPQHGRLTVGWFGNDLVLTDDPCDYIPVFQLIGSLNDPGLGYLDPLLREKHPARYSRIANLWETSRAQGST
jgi:hypothetical protein